jgi:hypothetical protein
VFLTRSAACSRVPRSFRVSKMIWASSYLELDLDQAESLADRDDQCVGPGDRVADLAHPGVQLAVEIAAGLDKPVLLCGSGRELGREHVPEAVAVAQRGPDLVALVGVLGVDQLLGVVEQHLEERFGVGRGAGLGRCPAGRQQDLQCGQSLLSVDDVHGHDPAGCDREPLEHDRAEEVRAGDLVDRHRAAGLLGLDLLGGRLHIGPERGPVALLLPDVGALEDRDDVAAVGAEDVHQLDGVGLHARAPRRVGQGVVQARAAVTAAPFAR